jgi:multisubunit Na+/H+ antiporter MnhB subunit
MKNKFIKAFVVVLVCLIIFLSTTFVPSVKILPRADFFQGFSIGAGAVTLIAMIYYFVQYKKQQKTIDQINSRPPLN